MKIIQQCFKFLPELSSKLNQIGHRSRICYQTEPKNNEIKLVEKIIKYGHNSCLEMAMIHLSFNLHGLDKFNEISLVSAKYITSSYIGSNFLFCSGSIRAWRELVFNLVKDKRTYALATKLISYLEKTSDSVFWKDPELHRNADFSYVQNKKYALIRLFDPKNLAVKYEAKHTWVALKIITNRAISHELVRHRPVSYLQESQRYCKYKDEITFVDSVSLYFNEDWKQACEYAEKSYFQLLKKGATPQTARTVLPNSCKTEIIVYCNLVQWEHILAMRHSKAADPAMQELMKPIFLWFCRNNPQHFSTKEKLKKSIG